MPSGNSKDEHLEEFLPYAVTGQVITADYSISHYSSDVRHNDGQVYAYNSDGHRGPEFKKNVGLLAVGCSVSHGIGLPLESTWAHMLAKNLNLDYNLLSFPGGGISVCVRQTIEYIYKYGAPEYLVCLLPDDERIEFYSINDVHNYAYNNKKRVEEKIRSIELSGVTSDNSIISEKELSVNIKYARFQAMSSFVVLARFCSLLNIKLLWGTWSDWDSFVNMKFDFMPVDPYLLKTHSTVSDVRQDELLKAKCHSDDSDPYFVVGSDEVKHWGTHYHTHVAQHFAEELRLKYGV